jgi:hypothetical protein
MLCWNNCRVYNKPGSEIYEKAVEMEQLFVQQLVQQYPDYRIPEGVIKGREPINVAQHIAQAVVSEKGEQHQNRNVNLYERHYARPMHATEYRGGQRAMSIQSSQHMLMNSGGNSRNGNSQSEKERSEVEVGAAGIMENEQQQEYGDSEGNNLVWKPNEQQESLQPLAQQQQQ